MSEKKDAENELKTGSSFHEKTETEQLYDDMTKPEDAEEKEEQAEQAPEDEEQDELILSEEELEIQREIESYQSKIEGLDAKLAAHEAQHIDALKREQMKEFCYSDEQIERYASFIEGETVEEIQSSLYKFMDDIPALGEDPYANPSLFNGRAAKPKEVDKVGIGRNAIKRVLHKIRL